MAATNLEMVATRANLKSYQLTKTERNHVAQYPATPAAVAKPRKPMIESGDLVADATFNPTG